MTSYGGFMVPFPITVLELSGQRAQGRPRVRYLDANRYIWHGVSSVGSSGPASRSVSSRSVGGPARSRSHLYLDRPLCGCRLWMWWYLLPQPQARLLPRRRIFLHQGGIRTPCQSGRAIVSHGRLWHGAGEPSRSEHMAEAVEGVIACLA